MMIGSNHLNLFNNSDYSIINSEISELISSISALDNVTESEITENTNLSVKVDKKKFDQHNKHDSVEKSCPNCMSRNIKLLNGNYICYECCSLLESTFDEAGEWKINTDNNNCNPRCNIQINPYLPETSSHTYMKIGGSNNKSDSAEYRYTQKFNQINSWSVSNSEKSLNGRLQDIIYYGNLCNLPGNAIDFTKEIYVEFTNLQKIYKKKKSSRGDCHLAILAIFFLISCKKFGIPRSPDDICAKIDITSTDFTKAGNLVFSVLQHSYLIDISDHQFIINSSDYINSFCRIMGIHKYSIIKIISDLEIKVNKLKILQKNTPQAIACGCIYFVCKMMDIKIDKADFDKKCNVSIPTLNKVFECLSKYTDQLIQTSENVDISLNVAAI